MLAIGAVGLAAIGGGLPGGRAADNSKPATPVATAARATKVTHVEAPAAQKLLKKDKEVVVLDVRTPGEFAEGHIENAKNVDFQGKDFATELGRLDRDKTYLVHCAAGGRSGRSLEVFRQLGFKSVVHLDGGMSAWTKAGLPVTTK